MRQPQSWHTSTTGALSWAYARMEAATSSTALSNVGVDAEGAVVDVLVVGNVASYPDNGNDMQRWPALERACM